MPGHILPHSHGESMNTEHILHVISQTDNFQTVAESFKILGDPTRIRIFWMLCHCEECVINISAMMDMSSPAVSHHLRQLKNAGLIVVKDFLIPYQLNFKAVKSDGLLAHRFLHAARRIDSTLCIDCSRIKGGTP